MEINKRVTLTEPLIKVVIEHLKRLPQWGLIFQEFCLNQLAVS